MLLSADGLETLHRYGAIVVEVSRFTRYNGYLIVRVPVAFAAWLETLVITRSSSSVVWHGRIPPFRDSISTRVSKLVLESLAKKVYLEKLQEDPAAVERTGSYIFDTTYVNRLRLDQLSNVEKLVRGAQEFQRSITLEVYQRCLHALSASELSSYQRFAQEFNKGHYVPKTPALLKALASKQGQARKQARRTEDTTSTSVGDA